MKLSHKLLYCIGVLIFSSSIGIFSYAYAVEPETQAIINNANLIDQKLQDTTVQLQNATAPITRPQCLENSPTITVNGVVINSVPGDDPSMPKPMPYTNCYVLIYTP